jgi:ABC-type nitrate/sulfonate/bicarbonate transport system ATPase subunit/ABC-type nitrate/sulfonate/bicarbonate transport system permease component
MATTFGWVGPSFLASIPEVIVRLYGMFAGENVGHSFLWDITISVYRVGAAFLLSAVMAIPLGILMSSYRIVNGLSEPIIDFIRYLPVPALVPLTVIWLGIGETSKIALLWIGTFFQLVLLIADDARRVPREYIEIGMTVGAKPRSVLRHIILPAMLPNMVDNLRITLGWCWTYLIVAEIAAQFGIGCHRWRPGAGAVDTIFAGILTIGVIGLATTRRSAGSIGAFCLSALGRHGRAPAFIAIERVASRFRRRRDAIPVIDDISIAIDKGELSSSRPSGCGKTTLMRIVGGLETASAARPHRRQAGPARPGKGMVFQSYSSFPWLNVIDNIRFGLKFRDDLDEAEKERRARHYLELVGLKGFESYYVNRISGGMRQRLAIARTLAAGPDVLLMDEPFGALDAQNRDFLQAQLDVIQRSEQKTIIFVTHDVEEAVFLADRIFIFSARPARILQEVRVTDYLPTERNLETKDSETFFKLRNQILGITRAQALRTEQIMMGATPVQ